MFGTRTLSRVRNFKEIVFFQSCQSVLLKLLGDWIKKILERLLSVKKRKKIMINQLNKLKLFSLLLNLLWLGAMYFVWRSQCVNQMLYAVLLIILLRLMLWCVILSEIQFFFKISIFMRNEFHFRDEDRQMC